jgi:hypothetical protein
MRRIFIGVTQGDGSKPAIAAASVERHSLVSKPTGAIAERPWSSASRNAVWPVPNAVTRPIPDTRTGSRTGRTLPLLR